MPTLTISVYLKDDEFMFYLQNKDGIINEVKELVKKRCKNDK